MRIELTNVNTTKLHDELIKAGITPSLVESLDGTTRVTVEDSQYDAVMAVVAVHNPNAPSIAEIKAELTSLDIESSRATEDLINTLGLDTTKLPQIMQDRLNRKIELRNQLRTITT